MIDTNSVAARAAARRADICDADRIAAAFATDQR